MCAMAAFLAEIVVESGDPAAAAAFWSAALGWEVRQFQPGDIPWTSSSGDPEEHDLKLVFVRPRDGRPSGNRLYLGTDRAPLADEVHRLRELGASPVGSGSTSHGVRLTDPGGTAFTVIPE